MIREEFLRLAAAGYNRIPLARETLADFDTPLSIYLKLADQPNSYLLESVQGGEKWGRYSIIGLPCRTVLRVHEHQIRVTQDGVEIEAHESEDPLAFVEAFKARYNVPTIAGLPRFNGGLVGYFGYDCVRYVEKRLGKCPNPDPLGVPDILLMVSDAVVVFDNLQELIAGCLDSAPDITLGNSVHPSRRDSIVVVTRKLWMKVIKALARWRWRA